MNRFGLSVLVLSIAACNGDEGPTACDLDFDCSAGELCGDGGTCRAATDGESKLFGRAPMQFDTGDEAYLLTVYDLPRGAAGDGGFVDYTLGMSTDAEGALRLSPLRTSAQADPSFAARSAFEVARRRQIDRLVSDLNSGRRTLLQAVGKQAACPVCTGATVCDGTSSCAGTLDFTFADGTPITLRVVDVNRTGPVPVATLVESSTDATGEAAAKAVVSGFVSTLGEQLTYMGQSDHSGADRDSDGTLAVVFTNRTATGVSLDNVGFFDSRDFLPASDSEATGNERDILWSRLPGVSNTGGLITETLAIGTLVHEYTHLVSYAVRVQQRDSAALREVLWLDEGIAHLMEDVTGWGPSSVRSVALAFAGWAEATFAGPKDTNAQRGQAMLLLRHVLDAKARAAGAQSADDSAAKQAAASFIAGLISEEAVGFEHAPFATEGASVVGSWLTATFATDNPDVTVSGVPALPFLDVATASTGHAIGLSPFATLLDSRGEEVLLEGPDYLEILDPTTPEEDSLTATGSRFYVVTAADAPGAVVLDGTADAQLDLHLVVERIR